MIVYLHIGTPKSGTSYIQDICSANRERLAADGVLWPGAEWGDQVHAVRDVLALHPGGEVTDQATGAWGRFVAEVAAWSGRAVVLSMEWLVHATPEQVRYIVDSLHPHEVRVVVTARDLSRCVPAQWQEQMQNWATWTWPEYLAAVTADDPWEQEAGRQFWRDHDLGLIVGTWSSVVSGERVTLVTVPGAGAAPELLWERFAEVVGLDPTGFDLDVPPANSSLGAASAELMRRVNLAGREHGLTWQAGDPLLKWVLAKLVLTARRGQEERVALPAVHHDWVVRESERLVAEVEAVGVAVVGSFEELRPVLSGDGSEAATTEQLLAAAVDGIAGMAVALTKMSEISVAEAVRLHFETAEETKRAAESERALAAEAERAEQLARSVEVSVPHPRRPGVDALTAGRWAVTRARRARARLRGHDRTALAATDA